MKRTGTATSISVLLWLIVTTTVTASSTASCPCDDEAWCRPIPGPPVRDREIFGFARYDGTTGAEFNWTHITTVAWAHDDALICAAHQHGVRAILAAPPFDLEHDMIVPARRATWIQDAVAHAQRCGTGQNLQS